MPLASLIAAVTMLGGLLVVAWGAFAYGNIRRSRSWPSIGGIIESARVAEDQSSDAYVIHVAFRYVIGGKVYRGAQLQFGGPKRYGTAAEARRALEGSFVPGSEVRVFYSPTAPARAVLSRAVSFNLVATLCVGCLLSVVGALLLLLPLPTSQGR